MSLKENECQVAPDGLDAVIEKYRDTTGIRDLEQAAEHIAANALYQIEVDHVSEVVFHADMVQKLLGLMGTVFLAFYVSRRFDTVKNIRQILQFLLCDLVRIFFSA